MKKKKEKDRSLITKCCTLYFINKDFHDSIKQILFPHFTDEKMTIKMKRFI